jgi:amino acid transporter
VTLRDLADGSGTVKHRRPLGYDERVRCRVNLDRLSNGEKIAGISAILLFVFMFFHWFGVEGSSKPNPLLIEFRGSRSGKSAWEALDYIPIILLVTIIVTLAVVALRLTNAVRKSSFPVNGLVTILGIVSVLLILYRIVDPPSFGVEEKIVAWEGTVQFPIFLALLAGAGIAVGGCLAMHDEGIFVSHST